MDELIKLSIQLHILFVVLLVGLIVGNLYLLQRNKTFFNLSKRLELLAPQYYIALSAIFFTGLIVMAVQQFAFSARIWEMIFTWIVLLGVAIRTHKWYKKIDKTEVSQNEYKRFALKKYLFDLVLLSTLFVLLYGVH